MMAGGNACSAELLSDEYSIRSASRPTTHLPKGKLVWPGVQFKPGEQIHDRERKFIFMTTRKLENKVVVLTGGSSGIGRASARLFSREGASLVIGDINEDAGSAVVKEIQDKCEGKAIFVRTDVSQPEQVEQLVSRAVETFGHLDVIFGNAGILRLGTAWETSIKDWQRCIDVNLGGNFFLTKYGVPALIEAGGGVILFTASEMGIVGTSGATAYCASKGGLINMTRAIAVDCAPYHIRVNSIAPGAINTPMTEYQLGERKRSGPLETYGNHRRNRPGGSIPSV
jgi:NAD(P)-dependent dehydrogenase (short-subunit alcohol dehydrogenase family)